MYGLKQAGKLANKLLATRLFGQGYYQCATTQGLWRHKWRPVIFALIVDYFGVQYTGRQHANHLLAALSEHYEVTTDWTGTSFQVLTLNGITRSVPEPHHGRLHPRRPHPIWTSRSNKATTLPSQASGIGKSSTEPRHNYLSTTAHRLMPHVSKKYRALLGPSSTMHEPSTTNCYAQSAPLG